VADRDPHAVVTAVFRLESAKLIARLARIVGDLGVAEDLAQEALVAALAQWPQSGVPDNPAAWLMAAAKNRAVNVVRRTEMQGRKHAELAHAVETSGTKDAHDLDARIDDDIGDDLLRLIFTACHPVLSIDARVALTLRLLGGLKTDEIARAFLVSETTIAQRIVRAKRTLAEKRIPFEVPRADDLAPRLAAVLGVIYLVFNEGYSATAGDDLMRPELCEDALRLGRVLAGLMPQEPEVHGLVALMELNASRTKARMGPSGEPVLLLEQDRTRWNRLLISRGLAALARAEALGGPPGPYAIQAAIVACHARALDARDTDWARVAALYAELGRIASSPVVELNRAVAVAMAEGSRPALEIVERLGTVPSLQSYHLLPSVRGDLLADLGRLDEARAEFLRAASVTRNAREQTLLRERADACARGEYRSTFATQREQTSQRSSS